MRQRPVILVVEDDKGVRAMLCRRLEREGYQPVPCPTGKDAFRLARTLSPDVIVLDAHLDGLEVRESLKQNDGTEAIPVLMISGTIGDRKHHQHAIKSGAIDYLREPLGWELVRVALRKVLAGTAQTHDQARGRVGTVLVADDEDDWLRLVSVWLVEAGFRVVCTLDHREVEKLAIKERPDCIVLDYLFKGVATEATAADVCRQLQARAELRAIPVVVLTGQRTEKYNAMNKGADHFVLKDGEPRDLLAAVRASVRRKNWSAGILVNGDIKLDPLAHTVYLNGEPVAELSKEQFLFFYLLVQKSPHPVSRAELFQAVLGMANPPAESRALDQLAHRTKQALGKPPGSRIFSSRKHGWRYVGFSDADATSNI